MHRTNGTNALRALSWARITRIKFTLTEVHWLVDESASVSRVHLAPLSLFKGLLSSSHCLVHVTYLGQRHVTDGLQDRQININQDIKSQSQEREDSYDDSGDMDISFSKIWILVVNTVKSWQSQSVKLFPSNIMTALISNDVEPFNTCNLATCPHPQSPILVFY